MQLIIKPASADINYQASYKEPILSVIQNEVRIVLIKKILETFELRLNNIKFNDRNPSNEYIHFSKYLGQCFFDVSFGLEEIAARIGTPEDEAQVIDLLTKLHTLLKDYIIASQKLTVQRHFEAEGSVDSYLQSLNATIPRNLQSHLSGRGVIYDLSYPEHELSIQILISSSIVIENGLYLYVHFGFSPNKYDFDDALELTKTQYDFILNELELKIASED